MKLFSSKNTTKASKNIKNFQAVAIKKAQTKALKGGNILDDVVEW